MYCIRAAFSNGWDVDAFDWPNIGCAPCPIMYCDFILRGHPTFSKPGTFSCGQTELVSGQSSSFTCVYLYPNMNDLAS